MTESKDCVSLQGKKPQTLVICLKGYYVMKKNQAYRMNELLLPVLNWRYLFLPWPAACVTAS